MTCEIINEIPDIENLSYLELGIHNNINFNTITCKTKMSVDTNGRAIFTGTTDQFFEKNVDLFDIIFIDANHDYSFVLNDFNNSVDISREWIILHDMIPPNKEHTRAGLCSDSYKLLYYIKNNTQFEIYTLDSNFGLTFIKASNKHVNTYGGIYQINPPSSASNISYEDFVEFVKTIRLYSNAEMKKILVERTYV